MIFHSYDIQLISLHLFSSIGAPFVSTAGIQDFRCFVIEDDYSILVMDLLGEPRRSIWLPENCYDLWCLPLPSESKENGSLGGVQKMAASAGRRGGDEKRGEGAVIWWQDVVDFVIWLLTWRICWAESTGGLSGS
jgi:hypothetical protein